MRRWVGVVVAAPVLAAVGAAVGVLLAEGERGVSADVVVQRLSEEWPLPDPVDNTSFCAEAGCRRLVTTDAVSVYEFADEDAAVRWVDAVPGDQRRVGRFVLGWTAREQGLTSDEARDGMVAELRELVGAE